MKKNQEGSSRPGCHIHAVQRMCVFLLYQYYLNLIAWLRRSHSQNPSTYLKVYVYAVPVYICM